MSKLWNCYAISDCFFEKLFLREILGFLTCVIIDNTLGCLFDNSIILLHINNSTKNIYVMKRLILVSLVLVRVQNLEKKLLNV